MFTKCFYSVSMILTLVVLLAHANLTRAEVLFESGTLGPTGLSTADVLNGDVPSSSIKSNIFSAVRLNLNQAVRTTQVGGHFVAPASGTFFGAIIALDNENDFPNSNNLTTTDVLGRTLLTFPVTSGEVFGDLALSLDPGWYALVFGSGLFGATTNGDTIRNGTDIGDPSYIGYQQGSGWLDLESLPLTFKNHRYVIQGIVVPEPSTIAQFLVVILQSLYCARRFRFQHPNYS